MRRSVMSVICLSLLFPCACMAQFAVLDAGNLVQNTTTALSMLKQVQTSAQQLIAEYNLVRNTITQIENQVKNLQRIPKGLSYIDDISLFGSRLSGLMATANGISFQLDQATRQFEQIGRASCR